MIFKRKLYIIWGLLFSLLLLFISGCNYQQKSINADGKIIVAVTILPQKAFVEAVCGDLVDVATIVPPGYSPGNYEPTPLEMSKFSEASVYFTIGVPAESTNILPKIKNMKIVDLAANITQVYPDREFSFGKRDPHIWLSPKRAKIMIKTITETMISIDTKNAQTYQENSKVFLEELDRVDLKIKETFSKSKNKEFIVFHPTYGYFADDFGLKMHALEQDGKECSPQHLQKVIDIAKDKGIKIIFSQLEIDSKQPDAFAEEIGGEKIILEPLSEDYISNLEYMCKAISEAMK